MKTCPNELAYEVRCPHGMACPLAHGAKEQLYHPRFYKTSPCAANCTRGTLCAFMHGPHDARQLLPDVMKHSHPIPGVGMLLEQHQPGFLTPPKYLTFEEPPRGVRSNTGEATTSRPPQLRRRQRRGAGSQRAPQAALAESPDTVLESVAAEGLSVPSAPRVDHLVSEPEGARAARAVKQVGSMWVDGAAERDWNDVGFRLGRLFQLPEDCD